MIDDFLVNDDAGTADKENPALAADRSGDFVVTWQDSRNGNWDIYGQRYNPSGTPLGSNFKVNDDVGTAGQYSPAVAVDSFGNFVITWSDERNVHPDIYTQRYDSSGTPLGTNFKVNDDAGSAAQWNPAIAMYNSGKFIITWGDQRNAFVDIYAQRYDSSGAPLGSNFKVNDDIGNANQSYPAVATDIHGNSVITWQDPRNGNNDIYAQRYDSLGGPLGANCKVNDDAGSAKQYTPAIAMDSTGNFVVVWDDERVVWHDIYAQRYSSSGNPLSSNFRVNDDIAGTTVNQWSPVIAMENSGKFVIAWQDDRCGFVKWDVYAQRYNSSGDPLGSNYVVSNVNYAAFDQECPAVAANTYNLYFVWMDNRRGNFDIYAKVVDWDWTKVEDENRANLPSSFELHQNYPNPFNPTTNIPFTVYGSQSVVHGPVHTTLRIYNIKGQLVRTLVDEEKSPGNYTITWDGKNQKGSQVPSGVYFYRVKSGEFDQSKRMVLIK